MQPKKKPFLLPSTPEKILAAGFKTQIQMDRALYFFLYLTGCKISEAKSFSISNLRITEEFIFVDLPSRKIPIPRGKLARCLEDQMWEQIQIFIKDLGLHDQPFIRPKNLTLRFISKQHKIVLTIDAKVQNPETKEWMDKQITQPCTPGYLRYCRIEHLIDYYRFNEKELRAFYGSNYIPFQGRIRTGDPVAAFRMSPPLPSALPLAPSDL